MSTFCYQSSIYSPYKAVWRIFKLILDACRISFNALNYIFVSWLFVMFIESCTWSIENTKQQIIRDKMLIALLMNLFTFYSRKSSKSVTPPFTDFSWDVLETNSVSAYWAIRRNSENIEQQNVDIAWQMRHTQNKERKLVPFFQKPYVQMYYSQLLYSNLKILHVPLDIQVIVLIAWSRYVCMKNGTLLYYLLYKGCPWTLMFHGTYSDVNIL